MKTRIPQEKVQKVVEKYLTQDKKPYDLSAAVKGVDTNVYRIAFMNEIFWLRIPSDSEITYEAEVKVHSELIKLGALVPEVVAYESKDNSLQRSVMIIRDMGGVPLEEIGSENIDNAVIEAGRGLALINSLVVDNYGYIGNDERNKVLHGSEKFKSFEDFCAGNFRTHLENITEWGVFTRKQYAEVMKVFEDKRKSFLGTEDPFLVHGDYKPDHIYIKDGRYSGVIDFSDIRGGSCLWDLAHARTFSERYYQLLKKGYNEVLPRVDIKDEKMYFFGLVEWVHKLNFAGWNNHDNAKNHLGASYIGKCLEYLLDC